jgi:signal transduction histidine kinase/DNA-binding response OmpR family regulator
MEGVKPLLMIIDDDVTSLTLLENIFKADYRLVPRKSGAQALKYFENIEFALDVGEPAFPAMQNEGSGKKRAANTPDLILLDIMMPGIGGFEVCTRLKANPDLEKIPIIFITGNAEPEDITRGFEIGAVDYVTKPFNAAELKARVVTHLSLKNAREAIAAKNILLEQHQKELENRAEWLAGEVKKATMTMNTLVENLPEGVALLDVQKRIVMTNPRGKDYLNLLGGIENGNIVKRLADREIDFFLYADSSRRQWQEVKIDKPALHYFKVAAELIGQGQDQKGAVLVMIDTTDEREILQRAQRQERLAAVGQLTAGISHDFSNILTVISGAARVSMGDESLSQEVHDKMVAITNQVGRGSRLIRQVLDFSRASIAEKINLDLQPLLKEILKMAKYMITDKIKISFDEHRGEEFYVHADPNRIQQVVHNLVSNARDAMPEGGEITLKLSHFFLGKEGKAPFPDMRYGKWVTFSCSDTGTGIRDDVLPRIFDPFFTTKDPDKGTGLGLAQVYGLVAQHEGFIDVKTRVGKGTTFIVYLPALDNDAAVGG